MANLQRSVVLSAVCVFALTLAGMASADPANAALAESLYQEGKQLMTAHRLDAACPKFAESYKLDPATGTLLNWAACEEARGHTATAWAHFSDALSMAKRDGAEARVAFAAARVHALEGKLTRLSIVVPPEANLAGLQVLLDGTPLTAAAFGVAAPVDPGVHVVEASAPGKLNQRFEVRADAPGKTSQVTLAAFADNPAAVSAVEPSAAAPSAAPTSASSHADVSAAQSPKAQRIAGYALLGAGALGVGVGVVFNLLARSENQKALDTCKSGPQASDCLDDAELATHDSHLSSARSDRTWSYVGFGVGAAALVTGGALLLTARSKAAPASATLLPLVDRRGLGVAFTRRF